eukprot:TRINITY_DN2236_c1_g4_i1.p1 TRINITY_DN2236_c1_g4~~TRINITY_DN2236_c1_g4_i1.p1  ORF type:complete len:1087 (+),score=298.52 TRINITY_DN2236_c1_g4_i1:101-3262(+)
MAAVRSSTPDAELLARGDQACISHDWLSSCYVAPGALSAPSSVTKGQALRSRGMQDLSPMLLNQRLNRLEQEAVAAPFAPSGTPQALRRGWGQGTVFQNSWTFWVDSWERSAPEAPPVQRLQEVGSFCDVKSFWAYFKNLSLRDIPLNASVHLMQTGVRPIWEDESNVNGGHFRIVISDPQLRGKVWQDLALALVGEQLEGADHICGCGATIKQYGTALSVWLRSRDPLLQSMVGSQLARLCGQGANPVFKPHLTMMQQQQQQQQQQGVQLLPSGEQHSPRAGQLHDSVLAARAARPQRRTRSASPSLFRRGSLYEDEYEPPPLPMSTVHPVNWSSGLGPETPAAQFPSGSCVLPSPGALLPAATASSSAACAPHAAAAAAAGPSPAAAGAGSPEIPRQQSKRALRAGVRCLNPGLVGEHGSGVQPAAAEAARGRSADPAAPGSTRRSRSDTHRQLYVAATPLSAQPRPARPGCSPGAGRGDAQRLAAGMPSPPAGQSPARTPQAWADAPWHPDLAASAAPSAADPAAAAAAAAAGAGRPQHAQQQHSDARWGIQPAWSRRQNEPPPAQPPEEPRLSRDGQVKVTMRVAPEGPGGVRAGDPHTEWQLHQRARDSRRQQHSPPPEGARERAPPEGRSKGGGRGSAAGSAQAPGGGQGKSASAAFVHKGYLYPPGLNRKQRRTIIFNSDRLRGEVPEGTWVGEEVPDGPVTDEELIALRAGKGIARTLPLADQEELGGRSHGSPAPGEDPDGDILQLTSPPLLCEQTPSTIPQQLSAPAGAPQPAPPQPSPRGGGMVRVVHVVRGGADGAGSQGSPDAAPAAGHHHFPAPDCMPAPPPCPPQETSPDARSQQPPQTNGLRGEGGESHTLQLNPDAAAFVPSAPPGGGGGGGPTLLNGMPYMQPPSDYGAEGWTGTTGERVVVVRHHGGDGRTLPFPMDQHGIPQSNVRWAPQQQVVTERVLVQGGQHRVLHGAPGQHIVVGGPGGGNVVVRRVVTGPPPGAAAGYGGGTRVVHAQLRGGQVQFQPQTRIIATSAAPPQILYASAAAPPQQQMGGY